ncbi:amidohydrolase family protein [Saccharothrix variisporea]|uniref:Cytosine/adenosine deaminase-related metal-dependent hydrolase n=1 Tax=Saccharothrix variisporea TaxID=543527 RepID=A0A495X4D1_9PSEU|nr:amidohydrolase family protein [Saccharothrix variisporea]RKT69131.1 cytosine/adenosine deaminase-related metal-dependent hydrolase [Saccharothrix variisporea]
MSLARTSSRTGPAARSRLIIKNGHLVTLDDTLGDLPATDLLVTDGTITAVGRGLDAEDAEVLDATGMVVLPGLVDSHRHLWQSGIGGSAAHLSLTGYVDVVLGGFLPAYQPEDVYAGVLWGALQALNAGITTVADWSHITTTPDHADENVRALRDSGVRAVFLYGPPIGQGARKWVVESSEPHPDDARRMRAEHFASATGELVTMGLALRGPEFSTPDTTAHDFALARDLDLPVSLHSGLPGYLPRYRTIDVLDERGLLGPTVHHAHGTAFTDHDLKRIAATGGSITPCPSIDMLMALGAHPVTGRALAQGLLPALGTDSVTGAGTDLFSEMRLALAAERSRANADAVARHEPPAHVELDHRDVLRLATVAGARAWHLEDRIGTLTPGKRADVVVIDTRAPHFTPLGDPVTSVVLNAGPSDVHTVLVDGRVVKRDGRLTGSVVRLGRELLTAALDRLVERFPRPRRGEG